MVQLLFWNRTPTPFHALLVSFYIIANPHVVSRQTMQHCHKLHCGPPQNLYLSFLIWSINQRLSLSPPLSLPLSLFLSLCAAEEELECVDMEGPVVCWESLGLPDLDCDEKPGWISSNSLAGELIQPSPQEVWTQPTHKHTLQRRGGFRETRQRDWTRDSGENITEEGRGPAMG